MAMPTHPCLRGTRLSEEQKRTVICPVCHAGIGHPCKPVSKSGIPLAGECQDSHDRRKAMAAYKMSRQKILAKAKGELA